MRAALERLMARRQIEALINSNPTTIQFQRYTYTDTPAGGKKKSLPPTMLPPQVVTLIPFKRRMTEFLVNTELGDLPDLPYVLVGFHTLDIKRHDEFTYQGDKFVVTQVEFDEEVRVAAAVDYFGGATNG